MASSQPLLVIKTKDEMRAWSRQQKAAGKTVALVPTMGYLHEGHLSLVKAARELADVVVSSIYINPTQFSANEDFDVYPRQPEEDRRKLASAACNAVFEPDTLYAAAGTSGTTGSSAAAKGSSSDAAHVVGAASSAPGGHETYVSVEAVSLPLCGRSRPHHFRGVATVVAKLFNIVQPDVAVFGRKDYQQWRLISAMVRDLDFPVKVVAMPICREPSGLAMSSRNARLPEEVRAGGALSLWAALQWAHGALAAGQACTPEQFRGHICRMISEAGGKVDYVELVDAVHLQPISDVRSQATLLALAAHFPAKDRGSVRLIDNTVLNSQLEAEGEDAL